jgi:type VI secretion system secreted protein VgrG
METTRLELANGDRSLSVRSFRVRQELSQPFRIEIVACSPSADLDFEDLIGRAASFQLIHRAGGLVPAARRWTGVCARCEQLRVEPDGLSTYELAIVPRLALLQQRRNYRLFQHRSVLEIATLLMQEWQIEHEFRVTAGRHPVRELRVQYGESDYDLLRRLLEEASISYYFVEDAERGSVLVLADEPHAAEPRPTSLPFLDDPRLVEHLGTEYCTAVRVRRELRPGRVVLRDFDFRRPRYDLVAQAATPGGTEDLLEQYHYVPGMFVTEGHQRGDTPTADDLGVARADRAAGEDLAGRMLQGEHVRRRTIALQTNAYDLCPGTTFSIADHPRGELGPATKLLAIQLEIRGETGKQWVADGSAVFTDVPYRPPLATPKPRINGVQSAIVVGPEDETVHTDEFGRVRVQFHWDRAGRFDPGSSCWMRVSQAWAGPGYGLFNLPRVGHEVLVGFVEGDPDQPVVVGRVFNGAQQVPYPLPGSKLMSGWKTDSNSNIILFDDTPGDEMFYTQAERNRLGIVKRHEAYITGGRRTEYIGTTEKTLMKTSGTRVALGNLNTLAGITHRGVGTISWKAQAGFGANIKAGHKFEACVVPVVPFITALLDTNDAKLQVLSKLPGGKAPDLKKLLPAYAGGPQPAPPLASAAPVMTQAQIESKLKETLAVVGKAVAQFEPEQVEELAESEDLEHAVDTMLSTLKQKGGEQAVVALADAQQLGEQLKQLADASALLPLAKQEPKEKKTKKQPQQDQEKQTGMFEKLLLAIVELILPKTKIEITHQKIKIHTEKASIELDKDDIKLEAKGDITIKADGAVKIEAESVSISPDNCKCA